MGGRWIEIEEEKEMWGERRSVLERTTGYINVHVMLLEVESHVAADSAHQNSLGFSVVSHKRMLTAGQLTPDWAANGRVQYWSVCSRCLIQHRPLTFTCSHAGVVGVLRDPAHSTLEFPSGLNKGKWRGCIIDRFRYLQARQTRLAIQTR